MSQVDGYSSHSFPVFDRVIGRHPSSSLCVVFIRVSLFWRVHSTCDSRPADHFATCLSMCPSLVCPSHVFDCPTSRSGYATIVLRLAVAVLLASQFKLSIHVRLDANRYVDEFHAYLIRLVPFILPC